MPSISLGKIKARRAIPAILAFFTALKHTRVSENTQLGLHKFRLWVLGYRLFTYRTYHLLPITHHVSPISAAGPSCTSRPNTEIYLSSCYTGQPHISYHSYLYTYPQGARTFPDRRPSVQKREGVGLSH